MSEEERRIKKWSNEEKVGALAKFIALRSGNPREALSYGVMLDCLFDEINKKEKKIQKQQAEIEKKDKMIDELVLALSENHCSIKNIVSEEICDNRCVGNDNWNCDKCIKQYFEKQVEKE